MTKSVSQEGKSPSQLIDARIEELGDWRGELLSRLRALVKEADPEVVEEWKWRGVPVWSHDGMICTGETYKNVVKMTFAKGAALEDPSGLFNSSLEGNTRRAIDFREGEKIDEEALKTLVRAAVTLNESQSSEVRTVNVQVQPSRRPRSRPCCLRRPEGGRLRARLGGAEPHDDRLRSGVDLDDLVAEAERPEHVIGAPGTIWPFVVVGFCAALSRWRRAGSATTPLRLSHHR